MLHDEAPCLLPRQARVLAEDFVRIVHFVPVVVTALYYKLANDFNDNGF